MEQQVAALKQSLLVALSSQFNNLIGQYNNLPLDKGMFNRAIVHFEDGLVWLEKAIIHSNIQLQAAAPQPEVVEATGELKEILEKGELMDAKDVPAPADQEGDVQPS